MAVARGAMKLLVFIVKVQLQLQWWSVAWYHQASQSSNLGSQISSQSSLLVALGPALRLSRKTAQLLFHLVDLTSDLFPGVANGSRVACRSGSFNTFWCTRASTFFHLLLYSLSLILSFVMVRSTLLNVDVPYFFDVSTVLPYI
jgi:hypothetical protein